MDLRESRSCKESGEGHGGALLALCGLDDVGVRLSWLKCLSASLR